VAKSRENDPRLVRFGQNVRRERVSRQLSQLRLAELVDLNVRTVQKIEAGKLNILLTTLLRFQKVLRCPWENLLG
jgi:transcriptional regulator with XRE-family HTH domain